MIFPKVGRKILGLSELNRKKERDTDEPFEVDNDCCPNKDRGEGESSWVEYQGEPLISG